MARTLCRVPLNPFHLQSVRFRIWIIDHVPFSLLVKAFETFLAVAMLIIGLALVFLDVRPGSVNSQVPHWMAVGWGASLLAGAAFTIAGLYPLRRFHRVEWTGQVLIAWGTGFYALALMNGDLTQTAPAALIYSGLAGVSGWRAFLISSEPYVNHRVAREAARTLEKVTR